MTTEDRIEALEAEVKDLKREIAEAKADQEKQAERLRQLELETYPGKRQEVHRVRL